jgi:quinolinate synthase
MASALDTIRRLKAARNAIILAHTYQPPEIQDIADFVGDSYGLSVEATSTGAETIIFCGVMFMAETAAILNAQKTVIVPVPEAGCPMAEMIAPADLLRLKERHLGHTVICYVNSTAEVKALSDICCTSSNALAIVRKLPAEQGIIFVPDMHLGSWVAQQSGHAMVLWNGFCPTHAKIKPEMVIASRRAHPRALVLIHPEAPSESRRLADQVLSTGGMCDFALKSPCDEFIIATEKGILHTLKKRNPQKRFYPVSGEALCPNMKKTSLESVVRALEGGGGMKVHVEDDIARKAYSALKRMLDMSR